MAESTIITGQFVRISQVPASLGERILARIIDYFLLFIYILATSYILGKLNIHAFSGSTFFLLFLFIYLPVLCYSLLCEVFNQGQSAGKKLMNIRVVKADGTTQPERVSAKVVALWDRRNYYRRIGRTGHTIDQKQPTFGRSGCRYNGN